MEKIKNAIKYIWIIINSKVFLLVLVGLFLFFLFRSCGNGRELKRQSSIDKQNVSALKGQIKIEKTKNKSLQASVDGYIANEKTLTDLNNNLSREVNDQKGKVLSLSRTVVTLKQDKAMLEKYADSLESVAGTPVELGGGNYDIPWTLSYTYDSLNFDKFKGRTRINLGPNPTNPISHLNTQLLSRTSSINLTFGQKVEDNKLRVFVTSNYPGLTPTSLEGVLIDPNSSPYIKKLMKKKMFLPNVWSVGVGGTMGYDFLNNRPALVFGVNVSYSLYQW